jgi:hypothetical protein
LRWGRGCRRIAHGIFHRVCYADWASKIQKGSQECWSTTFAELLYTPIGERFALTKISRMSMLSFTQSLLRFIVRTPFSKVWQRMLQLQVIMGAVICFSQCVRCEWTARIRMMPIKQTCMPLSTLLRRGIYDKISHEPLATGSRFSIPHTQEKLSTCSRHQE